MEWNVVNEWKNIVIIIIIHRQLTIELPVGCYFVVVRLPRIANNPIAHKTKPKTLNTRAFVVSIVIPGINGVSFNEILFFCSRWLFYSFSVALVYFASCAHFFRSVCSSNLAILLHRSDWEQCDDDNNKKATRENKIKKGFLFINAQWTCVLSALVKN